MCVCVCVCGGGGGGGAGWGGVYCFHVCSSITFWSFGDGVGLIDTYCFFFRQFAQNVKLCFLGKVKKKDQWSSTDFAK